MLYRRRKYKNIGFVVRPQTKKWLKQKAGKEGKLLSELIRETIYEKYGKELKEEGILDYARRENDEQ